MLILFTFLFIIYLFIYSILFQGHFHAFIVYSIEKVYTIFKRQLVDWCLTVPF